MFERLEEIEKRYCQIEQDMAKPDATATMDAYKKLAKEYADSREIVETHREWKEMVSEEEKTSEMLKSETDEEMKALIREEGKALGERKAKLEALLRDKL